MDKLTNSFTYGAHGLEICPSCHDIFRPMRGVWDNSNERMQIPKCESCIKIDLGAIKNRTLEIK